VTFGLGNSQERGPAWASRRLAYVVRKFREGIYVLMTIEGAGTVDPRVWSAGCA